MRIPTSHRSLPHLASSAVALPLLPIGTARASEKAGPLGVLDLWNGHPPGTTPQTFDGRPVISEAVPGAWWQAVLDDEPGLYSAYAEAARRLVDRGAVAISSGCGFTVRYQEAVAAAVKVPVSTGSLLFAPTVIRHLPPQTKLGVLTAHEKYVGTDLLGVLHDPAERARVVVDGISGSLLVKGELMCPTVELGTDEDTERHLTAAVHRLRAAHPDIGAFIFECSEFPRPAPKLRRMTGLPIYDHHTSRRLMLGAMMNDDV
ncbi:MAG: hypothetical protein EOQ36_33265 [Mesorhizobium sp.]|uniref:hypothetical protein n=1 Tax=Mesorhizobium sp. TaxID=1871066 RepID=UPI000FE85369|nr:hypothetical protein [Mesorhizobium sp.]RWF80009.1 MAG: hypothetical protein EOQ36_33265 [Mesorhizobium sp.]TJW50098.1 MAG: hypothetical protein E5X65_30475 [Mesorhizobium sp.]